MEIYKKDWQRIYDDAENQQKMLEIQLDIAKEVQKLAAEKIKTAKEDPKPAENTKMPGV